MYAYIKGTLTESSPQHTIIETAGVGFYIHTPISLLSKLPHLGETLLLHTSFITREDSQTLYGFIDRQEKELFEKLIAISGVGPKMALALIGHMPLSDLCLAVQNHEVAKLCKIPGVGKKTAERLIIELRDKLLKIAPSDTAPTLPSQPNVPSTVSDATSALVNLGYPAAQVEKALTKIMEGHDEPPELSSLITKALRAL